MAYYSSRYDTALALATRIHQTQMRKGTQLPYITHLVHVSIIVIRYGYNEDVAIAALLHDANEDQQYPIAHVEEQFGARVANLVAAMSERKLDERGQTRPWETRKREKMETLQTADADMLGLKAADLLHNARSILNDLRLHGPVIWERFSRGREGVIWYYREVSAILSARMGDHPLAQETAEAVRELLQEGAVAAHP